MFLLSDILLKLHHTITRANYRYWQHSKWVRKLGDGVPGIAEPSFRIAAAGMETALVEQKWVDAL
jgi:hypothetical protein